MGRYDIRLATHSSSGVMVTTDQEELEALLAADLVMIVPINDKHTSRSNILGFLAHRPDKADKALAKEQERLSAIEESAGQLRAPKPTLDDEEALPTTMDPRNASIGRGMERYDR